MTEKVKGPACYVPSIEKTYGQPIGHWTSPVRAKAGMKHLEIVNWLKAEHELGHANAIVALTPAETAK